MALNNYGKALGQLATESVKGSVKGFAMGIKGAAMSEMPGLTALMGLSREVKGRADKLGNASAMDASVKEQRTNNIISIEMVRQLRSINNNVLQQTRISTLQANNAKQTAMFAEEAEREKSQRDKELLDAIKALKGGPGATGVLGSGAGAGGKGFLGTLLDALQSASLLEAIAGLAGAGALYKGGKTIFGRGGNVPTTGGIPPTGGKPPQAPPTTGGGKVIPFPSGGRGGPPMPPTGGGGGLLRGVGLAARLAARGIIGVLSGPIGWALLAAEVGYEAYKIFGNQGGQGLKPPKPGTGAGVSTTPMVEGAGGAAFGVYPKSGMTAKAVFNAAKDSQAASAAMETPEQKRARGLYGVGDPRARSTVKNSENTTQFITSREGFSATAYRDTNRMAIGYGHNITDAEIKAGQIDLGNGDIIKISGDLGKDTKVTKEQADKLFTKDIAQYESIVVRAIGQEAYNKLSANQKTAILSYVYSVGRVPAGFADAIKTGNYANAAASLRNGVATASTEPDPVRRKQFERALKKRRGEEADLFNASGPATTEERRSSRGVLTNTSGPASTRSITPAGAGGGGGNEMETQNAIYRPTASSNITSGSRPRSLAVGPVQTNDAQANKTLAQQLKLTKAVVRATVVGGGGRTAGERLKETERKETKDQRYLRNANQTFLNQFQSTTQRLLTDALYKAIVVGAYGKEGSRNLVSKQEASAEGYRGAQLSKLFNLPSKTEKILTSAFGKKIGQAYAPMISQLGTAYLEVGARQVGRSFFAGILGNDEKADSLTGQILGNFAKGNKQAATEQLLYGLTGVASGPETIFAKYGFNSSQQGVNFLGGMGAAQMTAPLADMMGGKQPTYTGPYGQGTFGAGQYPMIQPGAVSGQATFTAKNAAGNDQTYANQALTKLAIEGDPAARKQLPSIEVNTWNAVDQAKKNAKIAEENFLKADVKTDDYRIAKDALDQANLNYSAKQTDILEKIAAKPAGGGSSAGGTFMTNMGNFAFDLGTSMVANKLTQNIKNPYLKAFANYGVASAANAFIKPMIFGPPTVAGAAAAPALFTAANAAQVGGGFMSGGGPGMAGSVGTVLTNSGYTTAGTFMSGVQTGMNSTLGGTASATGSTGAAFAGEVVGEVLPYAAAIMYALKGDYKKAATTAAGTYAGMKAGAYIGSFFGPGGTAIGATIGAIVGSILGSKVGRKPKPAVLRVTSSKGSEVSAVTTFEKDGPPAEWSKFADTLLVALLNSAKLMQQKSGAALPFVNIGIYMDSQSGVTLALYQEGEATNSAHPKWNKNFGSIGDIKAGTALVGMIEFMRDCLKEGKDAITTDKLDKATAELKTKNITTITAGLLNELKPGGRYDLTKGVGYDAGIPTAADRTIVARNTTGVSANTAASTTTTGTTTAAAVANTAATLLNGAAAAVASAVSTALTPGTKVNTSASLIPTTATTNNMTNSPPINSVVAVGGKTENDNSTTITNINQMSLTSDIWRQPTYNTGFQLVAA
jgi:GH24 family phage-related lysozyme (muramidase)